MPEQAVIVHDLPELDHPVLIAGYGGWGNALELSSKTAQFLSRRLSARRFARFDPDRFYRYDEQRPSVRIENGRIEDLGTVGGVFSAARTPSGQRDVLVLQDEEPALGWDEYVRALLDLCERLGVETVITIGSMFDRVLHSDRLVSGIASDDRGSARLQECGVVPVSYQGPSAIHSLIQIEGSRRGINGFSLWAHCPFYMQNTVHFGLQAHLVGLVADLSGFRVETGVLEAGWRDLQEKIRQIVDQDPKIQAMISEIRASRRPGSWEGPAAPPDGRVIRLEDFRDPG